MGTHCFNFAIDKYGTTWTTYTPHLSPCGDFNATSKVLPCCAHGDTCLGNALCRAVKPMNGTSGYYRSGCTDPNFPDHICRKQCKDHSWDVVFQPKTSDWACCNPKSKKFGADGGCTTPSPGKIELVEPFSAPAPDHLLPTFTIPKAGYVQQTSTFISSSTTPTTSPTTMCNQPMTAGTSAGIGVGVGLGTALIIVGTAFWVVRRRRSRAGAVSETDKGLVEHKQQLDSEEITSIRTAISSRGYTSPQELETSIRPRELQA